MRKKERKKKSKVKKLDSIEKKVKKLENESCMPAIMSKLKKLERRKLKKNNFFSIMSKFNPSRHQQTSRQKQTEKFTTPPKIATETNLLNKSEK